MIGGFLRLETAVTLSRPLSQQCTHFSWRSPKQRLFTARKRYVWFVQAISTVPWVHYLSFCCLYKSRRGRPLVSLVEAFCFSTKCLLSDSVKKPSDCMVSKLCYKRVFRKGFWIWCTLAVYFLMIFLSVTQLASYVIYVRKALARPYLGVYM